MNVELKPPYDLDAEEAVLGSLLIDAEAIAKVASLLKPDDFYREKNQWTYRACLALFARQTPTDQITIAQEMARAKCLEAAGGAPHLSHLVSQVPTSVHIEYYAQIVKRLSVARKLIVAGNKIAEIGYSAPVDTDEAIRRCEQIITGIRQPVPVNKIMTPKRQWDDGIDLKPLG